ncbi:MAG: sialate O-acetylesterase [Clostridia bacterium]|nr:sialate O-acetylesterase [Clostridia bacterium]
MIHSFLLIGQSNMAGRGFKEEVEPIENAAIKVQRNGRWWPMYVPVNPDRVTAGISLAESFADAYAKEHGVEVGLIPCADGGTCLDQWQVGGVLYDNAVNCAKLAQRTSTIAGVLWHQGESDCYDGRYQVYAEKFVPIMEAFRRDLELYDVPFLLGGLGEYLADHTWRTEAGEPVFTNYVHINATLRNIAATTPMTGYVSSEGLKGNPDNMHFSAAALREFGLRYYEEFSKLEDKTKVFTEKPDWDTAVRSALEAL